MSNEASTADGEQHLITQDLVSSRAPPKCLELDLACTAKAKMM